MPSSSYLAAKHSTPLRTRALLTLLMMCGSGCGPDELKIETLPQREALEGYRVESVSGVRDGDKLEARVLLAAGPDSLEMQLRFRIGVPTRLQSGHYWWIQKGVKREGNVTERSVTFLGGQSDRPNLGGVFELHSADRIPRYRVRLPTVEIGRP